MTHGHELKWENVGSEGMQGGGENGTTVIA